MAPDTTGILDEAYQRLHVTGPEFDGWLSNHGHGDEHVIKFADTAIDVHARTGDPAALRAALRAVALVPRG